MIIKYNKLYKNLNIALNVFVLSCYLSSSLLAMDLGDERISIRSSRLTTSAVAAPSLAADQEKPVMAPSSPSKWTRFCAATKAKTRSAVDMGLSLLGKTCSTLKGVGRGAIRFVVFRDSSQTGSSTVQKILTGATHVGVGVAGILVSHQPTEDELASANLWDHTCRNVRDAYFVNHCFHGAKLILDPIFGPLITRFFPQAPDKIKATSHRVVSLYEGSVNVVAGSGVVGYCRDMNSLLAYPGYGLSAIFLLRGGQKLFIVMKAHDPFERLHRFFAKSTVEHFFFTSSNSYLRRIMDGVAEVFAALTLHHAFWPFIYYKTMDFASPGFEKLRRLRDEDCIAKAKQSILKNDAHDIRAVTNLDFDAQEICDVVFDKTSNPLKHISKKQFLSATDHVCIGYKGKTSCAFKGKPWLIDDDLDFRQTLAWSPGWKDQLRADIAKGEKAAELIGENKIEEFLEQFEYGGIFLEAQPDYNLYFFVHKNYSNGRPFIYQMKSQGGKDSDGVFYPIVTPSDKWFDFENRYIYSLLAHSWLDAQNFQSFNILGRLMLVHGVLEIAQGMGGMLQATYKAYKAIFAYVEAAPNSDIAEEQQRAVLRDHVPQVHPRQINHHSKRKPPGKRAIGTATAAGSPHASPYVAPHLHAALAQPERYVPSAPKEKLKTKGKAQPLPQGKEKEVASSQGKEAEGAKVALPQDMPAVAHALDHRFRTLNTNQFQTAANELATMGVTVRNNGGFFIFQYGQNSTTIHLPHRSGQGAKQISHDRLRSLRTFIELTFLMARQEQK